MTRNRDPGNDLSDRKAGMRRQAEVLARDDSATPPEDGADLSPGAVRLALHELRVHQIELEMQNEELRRTHCEVETARERYFDLYDLAPVGYCTINGKGLVSEANLTIATLLGVPRSALINRSLTHFLVTDDQDVYFQHRRQLLLTGLPQACELRMLRPPAVPFWVRLASTVATDAEGAPACRITVSDITERRRAEEERKRLQERLHQSEKMEAIGQLAGGIAHDFNNQLSGIIGNAELLLPRLDDPVLNRYAQNITTAALRAADLTRQLLAFSRKGAGLKTAIDIHPVVLEVVELLTRSIDRRITLRHRLEATPSTVLGDPSPLQNAILNLGLNARDAMPLGGEILFASRVVTISEAWPDELPPGRYILISVTDTGTGMDAATRRQLFEPFFTTKGVGKGTGLGLASAYGTVRNHGGTIRVSSEPGRGSVFSLYLPVVDRPASATVIPDSAPLTTGHGRILVVDDEPLLLELLGGLLSTLGYTVDIRSDPVAALDAYRKDWRGIDLVILDMIMPTMGGRDLFLAMRAINPRVQVLITTGFSISGDAEALLEAGAIAIMHKPFRMDELARQVAEALRAPGSR